MYTTALICSIALLFLSWVECITTKPKGCSDEGNAIGNLLVTAWLAWLVILLIGIARFINGDTARLGTLGF